MAKRSKPYVIETNNLMQLFPELTMNEDGIIWPTQLVSEPHLHQQSIVPPVSPDTFIRVVRPVAASISRCPSLVRLATVGRVVSTDLVRCVWVRYDQQLLDVSLDNERNSGM